MSNPAFSQFSALALKVVGVILILSSLLDYVILLIPFNPMNPDWQISFTNQIVDRGIIPMVGISFLVVGYWLESAISNLPSGKISFTDLRFWSFLLAAILGLVFLLLVPVHLSNLGRASTQAMQQIEQSATQAEEQIAGQLEQVTELLGDNNRIQELDAAIASGQVQGEQLQQLQTIRQQIEELKGNPEAIEEQANQARTQLQEQRKEAENQAKLTAFKSGFRIGISSFLLSIGYLVIGGMGFRSLAGGGGGGGVGRR
ncbi:HpsJ family protein [Spirulina sp. CCNP1310]|uniref:hormogonium polysaccharide biosynthesis protein HpsJ n=1 Tax=Spirulina sp. CCNP1310 TaxID=3110249 RepID=UPI002B2019F5|nr:HpsJ family protein [Spirulina sp. CCNP1310]MEA5418160.1 HpsJ family protein [Spirulina sp. CCNP1310]